MGKSAGKIMPLPRGPYDATATYNILDMVTLNNKLWVAKKSGVKGVTPSDDAAEWMMAVDGTTDVKGLETTVNEKFSEIDTKFTGYDADLNTLHTQSNTTETNVRNLSTTVGNLNTSVSGLSTRCSNNENSINTLTTRCSNLENRTSRVYENVRNNGNKISVGCYIDNMMANTTSLSRMMTPSGGSNYKGGMVSISDNGDITIASLNTGSQSGVKVNNNGWLLPLYDGVFDLGASDSKFRNIYASTGTIQTSDRNEKKDIDALDDITARDLIMGLHPVTYKFINNTSDRVHYGLIAQDVETLLGHLGIENQDFAGLIKSPKTDEDGNPIEGEYCYGLRYDEFIAPLIKMCQNLQNEVTELRAEIETLKNK